VLPAVPREVVAVKAYRGFVIVAACLAVSARSAAAPAGDASRLEHQQSIIEPDKTTAGESAASGSVRADARDSTFVGARSISGVVYWDTNANGRRDSDEPGVWIDFDAPLETADLVDGFHDLAVEATWPDGRYGVTGPYLLLTGREAAFKASVPAQLAGTIHFPARTYTLLVNNVEMTKIVPGQDVFSVQLPVGLLKRLNTVSLQDGDWRQVAGISSFSWHGKTFVDQGKVFAWGYTHTLSKQRTLCFDLEYPGPPVRWCVKKTSPNDGAAGR